MYSRQSRTSSCFAIVAGIAVVFGAFFLWRGFLAWFSYSAVTPDAAVAATALQQSLDKTATMNMFLGKADVTPTLGPTITPEKVCKQFKVNVIRARIRECPKESCYTISLQEQGAQICVRSLAPEATDWYIIDMNPSGPQELGYMSKSVLVPMNPTPRPSPTLNLATVTPVPTQTPTLTFTAPPTNTPDTSIPPTSIPNNTATPTSPLQSAGLRQDQS
jgi:hypothetical protein